MEDPNLEVRGGAAFKRYCCLFAVLAFGSKGGGPLLKDNVVFLRFSHFFVFLDSFV